MPITEFADLPEFQSAEAGDQVVVGRPSSSEEGRMGVDVLAVAAAARVMPGQAGTGMPSFAAAGLVYEEATATIRGNTQNYMGDLPRPSLVAAIMPAALPRAADPVLMALNTPGANGIPLRTDLDQPVRARDLTPNSLHLILRGAGFRLLDPLRPRPQDWPFVYGSTSTLLTQAQADALMVSSVNSDFEIPGSFNSGTDVFWLGIPADNVPGVSRLVSLPGENRTLADFSPAARLHGFVAPNYMGDAFTWYYMSSFSEPRPHTYRLVYDYDNY